MTMKLLITVKTRQARGTGALAMDFKDRLKTWEDLRAITDFVNEDDRLIQFTCIFDQSGPAYDPRGFAETLVSDVFDEHATLLKFVSVNTRDVHLVIKNYAELRKVLDPPDLGVSHHRAKGDPYVEVD